MIRVFQRAKLLEKWYQFLSVSLQGTIIYNIEDFVLPNGCTKSGTSSFVYDVSMYVCTYNACEIETA